MAEQTVLGFADLLRRLRAEARLTQEELAEAARLSPRSVSDLERGINRTARKDTAMLLASALNLAGPVRALFVAAARGRAPAAEVLAAMQVQARAASSAAAGGVCGFPAALSSFIGREGAVREVAGLLEEYRLVTVTGPGGVGKTRLAGEVARRLAGRFADGVWLAELAVVQDPTQVATAVAAALGVREQPGLPLAEALARMLARQQLLLVLDNCEHVAAAVAGLCSGLLLAADDVRVLATSREPLAVAGEARYRLGPLILPGPDDPAEKSEAVMLFADRARRADARFELDCESRPVAAELVARLDGIPLAIELAAAQVEALGVVQLLELIDDRFGLLVSGDRMAAGRHRSLAAAMEWSYQLLDSRERHVFRAVSVFPGPFTLAAAEAVAGAGAGSAVLRLVNCSLVVPPRVGPDGRSRYGMLDTLRAYGARLLAETDEADDAAAALAGYALQVAEEAAPGLQTSTDEVAAIRWLDAEDATTRQALAWAADHDPAIMQRLAVALGWWWVLRGRLLSQTSLLHELARCAVPGSDGWCTAQFWLGWAGVFSADLAAALDHFTELRDTVADRGASRALADALAGRAGALANMGRFAEAADDARRSLAMTREVGYPAGEALALVNLTATVYESGDYHSAVQLAREAAQLTAKVPGSIARTCSWLLADILTDGDPAAAERVCAAGLVQSRGTGDMFNLAALLVRMALLDVLAGRADDAADHLREGLQTALRAGLRTELLIGLERCAHLCAATGRSAEAVTAWSACAALSEQEGFADSLPEAQRQDKALREARRALGPNRSRAAAERGAAMSLDTATEYALMLTTSGLRPLAEPEPQKLSARERELVTLVAQGRTDAEIAAQLYISIRTVRSHLDRIRDKTGCRRRADLTRLALQTHLV